jgi:hypothetical protein
MSAHERRQNDYPFLDWWATTLSDARRPPLMPPRRGRHGDRGDEAARSAVDRFGPATVAARAGPVLGGRDSPSAVTAAPPVVPARQLPRRRRQRGEQCSAVLHATVLHYAYYTIEFQYGTPARRRPSADSHSRGTAPPESRKGVLSTSSVERRREGRPRSPAPKTAATPLTLRSSEEPGLATLLAAVLSLRLRRGDHPERLLDLGELLGRIQ